MPGDLNNIVRWPRLHTALCPNSKHIPLFSCPSLTVHLLSFLRVSKLLLLICQGLIKQIHNLNFVFKNDMQNKRISSVAQSCLTLCDPMDCSTPGLPVHHQLPESTQTQVGDAIQRAHPLSPPSPPTFNLSRHQGLFKCGGQRFNPSSGMIPRAVGDN